MPPWASQLIKSNQALSPKKVHIHNAIYIHNDNVTIKEGLSNVAVLQPINYRGRRNMITPARKPPKKAILQ
jgi:hypothetical protein